MYLSDNPKLVAYKFIAKAEEIQDDFINEEVNDIYTVLGDRKIDKSDDNIIKFSFLGSKVGCGNVCLNKDENDLFILIYSLEDTQEAIKKYEPTEPYNPEIGMSKEDILASTWGEPNKINRTTYEWGVIEQWCYQNNEYIYFEDGIVTVIQESN